MTFSELWNLTFSSFWQFTGTLIFAALLFIGLPATVLNGIADIVRAARSNHSYDIENDDNDL